MIADDFPLTHWIDAFAVSGTIAYVASGPNLEVVDVSEPSEPRIVGVVRLPETAKVMAVADGIAYVADYHRLHTIDVSDPVAPRMLGSGGYYTNVTAVAVSGSTVYLGSRHGGIQVLDVSDPAAPRYVGEYPDVSGRMVSALAVFHGCLVVTYYRGDVRFLPLQCGAGAPRRRPG